MHPHEREDLEYQMGVATDLQNAFAWNSMNRKPDDTAKINAALEQGKFVIVEQGTDTCPSTDAAMGSRQYLLSTHDTREQAEAAMAKMFEGVDPDDINYDIATFILPAKPYTPPTYQGSTDDEIPF